MSIHCCAKSIPYNGTAVIVLRFIRYELYYIVFLKKVGMNLVLLNTDKCNGTMNLNSNVYRLICKFLFI